MKITFVCSGNTCRSPMAEVMFKAMLKAEGVTNVEVQSRGVVATAGTPMSANAKKALRTLGYTVSAHKAKQMTQDDFIESDLIIPMTERHKMRLGALPKVFTISRLTGCPDITDPFGGDEEVYLKCAEELKAALEKLLPIVKRQATLY